MTLDLSDSNLLDRLQEQFLTLSLNDLSPVHCIAADLTKKARVGPFWWEVRETEST